MDIAFPFSIGADGRAAGADTPAHINHMIQQLIFTNPGERVNRPDFGGGIHRVLFAPNSVELQATVHFTLLAALQQYLGDVIEVTTFDIQVVEESFGLTLEYRILRTEERVALRLEPLVA
jgi:phage baseplate assembly protein W